MDSSTLRITLSLMAYDMSGGAFGTWAGGIMRVVAQLGMLANILDQTNPGLMALLGMVAVSGGAFVLFAGALGLAVTAGAQLQMAATMASIAISDGSQHVNELTDAIVKLANTSQYKIADVDMAFRVLGGLGFNTGQILGGLGQAVITLAQAMGGPGAGISLADAAQLVGQAFYIFGPRGTTVKQIIDALTGAFYSNMMSVSDLTSFMGMAGGTASSLGVSLHSLLTFGSMLTPMFGSASSAGASLSYMMRNLAHPATQKMADMIQHLGLKIYDTKGNFVGLKSIMDQLFADTKGMTEQQKMDVFGTLFNVRSGRAAMDLMSETQSQFDTMYNRVYGRITQVGQAQRDSNAINNTTIGTWERLKTTLNDFFAKAGEGIGTALIPLMNAVNNLLSVMQANPNLMKFIGAFLLFGTVISGLTFVISAGIGIIALFGGTLAAVFLPVTLIIGGIAALVAILIFAYTHWTGFRQVVQAAMGAIAQFGSELGARLGPALTNVEHLVQWLAQQWTNHWNQISGILGPVWHVIEGIIRIAWSIITGIFKVALDLIGGRWSTAWHDIQDMLRGIWNGIGDIVQSGIMKLVAFVATLPTRVGAILLSLAQQAVGWGFNIIANLAKGILNGIGGALSGAMNSIGNFIKDHLPHSPAKMGPLVDLESWGGNITKMLAVGMVGQKDSIGGAFSSLFSSPATTAAQGLAATNAAGGGQAITVQLQVDDKVLAEAFFTYVNGQMRQNGYTRINR